MHFILRHESFGSEEIERLRRPSKEDGGSEDYGRGQLVSDPPPHITFRMDADERGRPGDYVLTGLPGMLISARFRSVLDRAGIDNIQYVPAKILEGANGTEFEGYFVANIIGLVDCIDYDSSELTMQPGMPNVIQDIDELHLDESKTRGSKLFRLAGWSTLVLFCDSVKNQVEAENLLGVGFVPAEGFSI